ncbi:hypothetical protein [Mycetocola sp.]|uniref:hypothetical protein n=1 Tax=Mycetocola sp. TaxID=1871042 RepID=UPI00398A001F
MKLLVDCRWVTENPDDQLSRRTRGIVHALAERRSFVMIVGPTTALDLLPALPWELLPSPYSPAELFTGRKLNSIGADVVFTPAPGLMGLGRRFGLLVAGGTPHCSEDAHPLHRLLTWPWRFRFTRSWMMRSADVVLGVSGAQQRLLLGDSSADQQVVTLHTEDAASVSPDAWRESAAQLDAVIDDEYAAVQARRDAAGDR